MTRRVQTIRSAIAGFRPSGQAPGTLYANWADKQLGVVDSSAAAMDLVAVRFFATTTSYVIGDFVVQAGQIYRAVANSAAGAFAPANWAKVAEIGDTVTSFNGRNGVVVLTAADLTGVGGALLASPVFTGAPQAPTPASADNDTSIATTAFVKAQGYAPLDSPALTG